MIEGGSVRGDWSGRDIGESDNLVKRMPGNAAERKAHSDAMLKAHGAKIPAPDLADKKKWLEQTMNRKGAA